MPEIKPLTPTLDYFSIPIYCPTAERPITNEEKSIQFEFNKMIVKSPEETQTLQIIFYLFIFAASMCARTGWLGGRGACVYVLCLRKIFRITIILSKEHMKSKSDYQIPYRISSKQQVVMGIVRSFCVFTRNTSIINASHPFAMPSHRCVPHQGYIMASRAHGSCACVSAHLRMCITFSNMCVILR